jgi:hypothetical protein
MSLVIFILIIHILNTFFITHSWNTFLFRGFNYIYVTILSVVFEWGLSFLLFFFFLLPSSDPYYDINFDWKLINKSFGWIWGFKLPIDKNPFLLFYFKSLSTYVGNNYTWPILIINFTAKVTPATTSNTRYNFVKSLSANERYPLPK